MNAKQIWQAALGELQVKVPGPSFQTWLKNTSIVALEGNEGNRVAVIAVPSNFAKEWLENKFLKPISETLHNVLGYRVEVRFEVRTPPRGEQVRALHALDGLADTQEEMRMVAGDERSGIRLVGSGGQAAPTQAQQSGTPRQIHGDREPVKQQATLPPAGIGTSSKITSLVRNNSAAQPLPANRSGTGGAPMPVPQGKRGGAVAGWQFDMGLEEASMLNPRYIFERFIVGKNNQLAHAASRAVSENPAGSYNPLFLYGGVGMGKTHLLHAIGHEVMRRHAGTKVLYVSSEKFTNDLINAIRDQRNDSFRNIYRSVDVLLIDDVQFIAGKESTQEEFFHTFNALHGANKQIVLCSDRPPKAMLTLEERLRSRFEWGLVADIQPPDLETRIAILRAKAEQATVAVPGDVIDFIARKVQSNIRELEGALNRIIAYAQLNSAPVSVDLAATSLSELGAGARRKPVNADRIVETVSSFFNLEPEDLKTGSRSREVLVPRQIAMFLMREEVEMPFIQIAAFFGKRDHTTAMHSYEKIENLVESDNQMRQDVLQIRQMMYGEHER
jgi:chromosomal replication initiator protein